MLYKPGIPAKLMLASSVLIAFDLCRHHSCGLLHDVSGDHCMNTQRCFGTTWHGHLTRERSLSRTHRKEMVFLECLGGGNVSNYHEKQARKSPGPAVPSSTRGHSTHDRCGMKLLGTRHGRTNVIDNGGLDDRPCCSFACINCMRRVH